VKIFENTGIPKKLQFSAFHDFSKLLISGEGRGPGLKTIYSLRNIDGFEGGRGLGGGEAGGPPFHREVVEFHDF